MSTGMHQKKPEFPERNSMLRSRWGRARGRFLNRPYVLFALESPPLLYEWSDQKPHSVHTRGELVSASSERTLPLHSEYITLSQAVKVIGLAGSGGQAKHLIRSGAVRLNGVVETQPGRKLRAGD